MEDDEGSLVGKVSMNYYMVGAVSCSCRLRSIVGSHCLIDDARSRVAVGKLFEFRHRLCNDSVPNQTDNSIAISAVI